MCLETNAFLYIIASFHFSPVESKKKKKLFLINYLIEIIRGVMPSASPSFKKRKKTFSLQSSSTYKISTFFFF